MYRKSGWLAAVLGFALFPTAPRAQLPSASPTQTLSAQMQAAITHSKPPPPMASVAQTRAFADAFQASFSSAQLKRYPVGMTESVIAGVPVRLFEPKVNRDPRVVLLNLHGGGFLLDSGSLTENIPIAALTGFKVVAVRYRLAPEHPFPAAIDDALAVYRELLKTHDPKRVVVYGTSAGAILGPELIVRLLREHVPLPAALGVFAGNADFARQGESKEGSSLIPENINKTDNLYIGTHSKIDPEISPIYGDLSKFPPTYCISSTRDFLLSATENFCRALEQAGVPVKITIFNGPPHAFWSYIVAPESDEAFSDMARYFSDRLGSEKLQPAR